MTPPPPLAEILKWQARRNPSGTVIGHFWFKLPSGLVLHELRLMRGSAGKLWIGMPAHLERTGDPVLGPNGKPLWNSDISFASSDARKRFETLALDALRASHPEVLVELVGEEEVR